MVNIILQSLKVTAFGVIFWEIVYYFHESNLRPFSQPLATQNLAESDRLRANRFKQAFVTRGMSKYNLGGAPLHIDAQGRRMLLVPGQVEDDASIMLGSPVVRTNQALLHGKVVHCYGGPFYAGGGVG